MEESHFGLGLRGSTLFGRSFLFLGFSGLLCGGALLRNWFLLRLTFTFVILFNLLYELVSVVLQGKKRVEPWVHGAYAQQLSWAFLLAHRRTQPPSPSRTLV